MKMRTMTQAICILVTFFLLSFYMPLMAQDGSKLIEYIMYQEFDKAKELINNGADVNYQDESSGSTPLMLACQYNFMDMATFLIEHKADLNLQSKNGQTALMASAGVSEDLFNLLLSKGADFTIKANDGTTAFTQACMGVLRGRVPLAVVQTLLEKGADVDEAANSGGTAGYTCLMMAARNHQPDLVKLLVSNGADINKKAKDGKSALSLAREENDTEMAELLKKLGAKE
jgi:ankyrin repeat protein